MPEPTLLTDIIQPAWQSLTAEQRSCWHFWAAINPTTNAQGELRTNYGNQAHYKTNANLAVPDTPDLISDPPTSTAVPVTYGILTIVWPISALLQGLITIRGGIAILTLDDPAPVNQIAIITQSYTEKKSGGGRPPRVRHVRVIVPLDSGTIDLRSPDGYFATTAGNNRFARIKGVTARRRPDQPLCKLKIVHTLSGKTIRQVIANPTGGSPTGANRARATSVDPRAGDHFP